MTPQEIDSLLAGPELDLLIQEKVFGFTWDPKRCRVCGWELDPAGKFCRPVDDCSMRPLPKKRADEAAQYSTEIHAAWAIVELMAGKGWEPFINNLGKVWSVSIFTATYDILAEAKASTAPLAICRSALKAFLSKEPA